MRAMLLAAGLGTRMGPLCAARAKPALRLFDQPLILLPLSFLRRAGAERVAINLHHRPETLAAAAGEAAGLLGLELLFSWEEGRILGTAGGLKRAEALLAGGEDPLLLVNSDTVYWGGIEEALAEHRRRRSLATLLLRPAPPGHGYGSVRLDEQGRVLSIAGRPEVGKREAQSREIAGLRAGGGRAGVPRGIPPGASARESDEQRARESERSAGMLDGCSSQGRAPGIREMIFIGIHLLEPEIFRHIAGGVPLDINSDIYPRLIEAGLPVHGAEAPGDWLDFGTPGNFLGGTLVLLQDRVSGAGRFPLPVDPPGRFQGEGPAGGGAFYRGPGVDLHPSAHLELAAIGAGCRIGAECRLVECLVMERAVLGRGVRLERCLVGPQVGVPDGFQASGSLVTGGGPEEGFRADPLEARGK